MTAVKTGFLVLGASLICARGVSCDVHLVRRVDGSLLICNDVGSGWTVRGKAPSDSYLVDRKNAVTPFDQLIEAHSRQEGVDPKLVKSVMLIESDYNPRALSRKGACGLMQLMPATARQYGVRNFFDATENIRGGVKHLANLLAQFRGDIPLTLAAYNAGAAAVTRHFGVPPYPETQEYVRRGMVAYEGRSSGVRFNPLGGAFRSPRPVLAAGAGRVPRVPAFTVAAIPVRVQHLGGSPYLSNGSLARRETPVLGRVVSR